MENVHRVLQDRDSETKYDEYLMAMKRVHHRYSNQMLPSEIESPRVRYRKQSVYKQSVLDSVRGSMSTVAEATRVGIISSMVPDEIIYKHCDYSIRNYETALMFCDVSGFTDLCEKYTSSGRGGPSRLTKVLNSYIGAMVQEILAHNGDVLKFAGDAFLSMWKKTARQSMQDVVHNAIDCGLIIQKNYGTFKTDIGVVLKVKVAISAGLSQFSIIGDENIAQSSFVIVGQPVWDVKMAQYLTKSGDVLTSGSAWKYVNEAEYCTQPCGDGRHTKVLGVGASWKRVEKLKDNIGEELLLDSDTVGFSSKRNSKYPMEEIPAIDIHFKEYSLRPAVIAAMRSSWWPGLCRFMVTPVLRAVENDEPMDFLTEVRRVVVVFFNIITKTVTPDVLIDLVDRAYKHISCMTSKSGGLVNKVSMFDKDMMFLIVFGLRGLKHEDEAQHALLCAFELKENLANENIISISVGITSGTTYCGVVGHVLRREYTVIGPAVNKAARLMTTYVEKVTCDKETFLRSKLDQEYFKQLPAKPLKGIAKPGPVYEFNKSGWPDRPLGSGHPILGRNDELRKFKMTLQNALEQQNKTFTRYRDHKYGVVFTGPKQVGKSRMLEECLNITPDFIRKEKMVFTGSDKEPYHVFRNIMNKNFRRGSSRIMSENKENKIRFSINMMNITPLQIYGINTAFDCRFPLPESFQYTGKDIMAELPVKNVILNICKNVLTQMWVIALEEAQHVDIDSWRLITILLETKQIFFIMTITDIDHISEAAMYCLSKDMMVLIPLAGIDRTYHAALVCQLLDVQAIPADLEKVIESASGGMPGWIQNFVISLVQRGALTIITTSRQEVQKMPGLIIPTPGLLQKPNMEFEDDDDAVGKRHSFQSIYSMMSVSVVSRQESQTVVQDNDTIQVAVLDESYTFEDLKVDMTMDAIILKTYDSLTPFEKMLLKCGSVLGDVFSRRMLLNLLQSDSPRKVAQAVAKLFRIRVLECEGGDFTRDTSFVLVHPAPSLPKSKPPYCACLGTRQPANCRDLPMYAFCGYMKFRHCLFRTTTYDLLTESQKHEMHARALLYLERYTRRCASCGAGCFTKLLGLRCDDGLIDESEDLKRMRLQISALSAESRMAGEESTSLYYVESNSNYSNHVPTDFSGYELLETEGNLMSRILESKAETRASKQTYSQRKRVRSFSSLELESCECLSILQSVYCQVIDHCRGAGEKQKLFEAYLEYADLCINVNPNIPQAVRLLFEVEDFLKSENDLNGDLNLKWVKDFSMAKVCSMRGVCMLQSGDLKEARKQLMHAMKLYCKPFPTSSHWVRVCNMGASIRQFMTLYVAPNFYIAKDSGVIGLFYEDIARTLNRLYSLFIESKEPENATLAAKWALNYALRTNSNLRLLSVSYANMIADYREKQQFSRCLKLEKRAIEVCRRKRGQLDVTEVQAVSYLYTNIFLFYVDYGKKMESLEFGLSVLHMLTSRTDICTRESLVLCMLKLLLSDLKISDMVAIMREFFYLTDHYDLCAETWYYYYAIVILLDTGYCVESYRVCEKFYMKKGDALLRAKTPEAAWNFFVCMWLITIRMGAWERSILWEEKIKQLLVMKLDKHEFTIMMVIRLVEGLLVTLVKEMDNRNIKKIIILQKNLKTLFQDMLKANEFTAFYKPRYYLMLAYYNYIRGRKYRAYNYLNKARDLSMQSSNFVLMFWVEHTRNHWKGTLNPKYIDFWTDHIDRDNLLDYRDFDPDKGIIIPFTLPLPRDLEK
ncbi:adenylate cyclase type 10-like [Trichoplusia ni]|uniref:Adenylate cyclase type 10-like n=1 Tax=Trichoplusia ni TaxID=7111 RepID=A0A7E5WRN3_TRINI|nr:adenylate cyclase type 10-like [Trichoplusia ni]